MFIEYFGTMSWLYIALLAYLINAIAFVIDKYLLSSHIPNPTAYAFWMAILSVVAVFLIPFGITIQSLNYGLIALASGGSFFLGLIFLYKAIKANDVSVASTMCGVVTAVSTYVLAIFILNESTGVFNLVSIVMLIVGMMFIGKTNKGIWRLALLSGILFGASFALLKLTFDISDFVNGVFWTRMGFVGFALVSLLFAGVRKDVGSSIRNTSSGNRVLFVGNKVLTAVGFLLLYYAIRLGEVSVVNSLLGFQFLFIFIIAITLRYKISRIEERVDTKTIIHKLIGTSLIIAGFLMVLAK